MPYEEERRAREAFACDYCRTEIKRGQRYTRAVWPPRSGEDRRKGVWRIERSHLLGDCPYEHEDYFPAEDEFEPCVGLEGVLVQREVVILHRNGGSSSSTIASVVYATTSNGQSECFLWRHKREDDLSWEDITCPISYRDIELGGELLWVRVDLKNRMRFVRFRVETLPWQDEFGWWLWAQVLSPSGESRERIPLSDAGLSPTGVHFNWNRTFRDTEENRDFLTRVGLLYPLKIYLEFANIIDDFVEVPF